MNNYNNKRRKKGETKKQTKFKEGEEGRR